MKIKKRLFVSLVCGALLHGRISAQTQTSNYISKFYSNPSQLTNSHIYDNGTGVGINTDNPGSALDVQGITTTLIRSGITSGSSNSYASFMAHDITNNKSLVQMMGGGAMSGTLFGVNRAGSGQLYTNNAPLVIGTVQAHNLTLGTNNTANMTIKSGGNIGINITNPLAKLHVSNGSLLLEGTTGGTPTSGAGTRMMWIPAKGAFRAGVVASNEWDDANIGNYSIALGSDVKASGDLSTVIGNSSSATVAYATAIGFGSLASHTAATAIGGGNTASGYASTALGSTSTASNNYSIALGTSATSSGEYAMSIGRSTSASGNTATAMGYSTAATGYYSFASGISTTSQAYGSFVTGRYNIIAGNTSSWVATDPLFVIGNGSGTSARSNAVTVLKNGKTLIGNPALSGFMGTPDGYLLFVQQGILAEKVKVAVATTSDWSDYVLDKNYKLENLDELEEYILINGHLRNIPSAKEVVKNGIDVAKMDASLLAKIEELTLHAIRQNKEIEALKKEVLLLKK